MTHWQRIMPRVTAELRRLRGGAMAPTDRWLRAARILWVAIVVPSYILWITQLPTYAAAISHNPTARKMPVLSGIQLSMADLSRLHSWGISLPVYAAIVVALTILFHLTYGAVGLLLFWRRPNDWMAFVASFALMMLPFGFATITLAALPHAWLWIIPAVAALGNGSLIFCGYVFPDGRFAPRWVRWLGLPLVGYTVVAAVVPAAQLTRSQLTLVIFLAFALGVLPVQIYRYRAVSTPYQRQQTKWVVLGITVGVVGDVASRLLYTFVLAPHWGPSGLAFLIQNVLVMLTMLTIPLAVGVAVFSAHLWDIDLVIRRTVLYSALSTLLAAIYAATVFALQSLIHPLTGMQRPGPLVITVSTLLVAVVTNPLRRWLQGVIDRRFYRRHYQTEHVLSAFADALHGEADLSQLRQLLLSVVDETMRPAHLSLWLATAREDSARHPEGELARASHEPSASNGDE